MWGNQRFTLLKTGAFFLFQGNLYIKLVRDMTAPFNAFNFSLSKILFTTLFRESPSGPIPALSSSYQVTENALCYRFFIRKDAKWSDGSLLLAEDVIAAWEHTQKTGR